MNDESENFEALRQLIALKRYEQPPPGYFNQLPNRIIVRLQCVEPTFLEKLTQLFAFRPAMAYALGLAFCGTFATGVAYSLQSHSGQAAFIRNPGQSLDMANSANLLETQTPDPMANLHARGYRYSSFLDTNETAPKSSLFQGFEVRSATVSYPFGAR